MTVDPSVRRPKRPIAKRLIAGCGLLAAPLTSAIKQYTMLSMFTGIIQKIGTVKRVSRGAGRRDVPQLHNRLSEGAEAGLEGLQGRDVGSTAVPVPVGGEVLEVMRKDCFHLF